MSSKSNVLKPVAEMPLVSIITPSFNQVEFVEACVRSVLGQDYPHIEYIVIDGRSTDGSQEILKSYRDRFAHYVSEPDEGQADAINKGLKLASGEVVAWLNSDDLYLSGAVANAVRAFREHSQAGLVYGDGIMVDEELRILDYHPYPQVDLLSLLRFEVILQPAVFMRRTALQEVGFLNPGYDYILDHELWIRIAARYPLQHVAGWWALERTHVRAKTTADAAGFVEEAENLIRWAFIQPKLRSLALHNERRIVAGLHAFCGRRLIDAGAYATAVGRLLRSLWYDPATFARYWYKFVQAFFSMIGLGFVFRGYRKLRRRVQYRGKGVDGNVSDVRD